MFDSEKERRRLDLLGVEKDEILSKMQELNLTPNQRSGLTKEFDSIKAKIEAIKEKLYNYVENKH